MDFRRAKTVIDKYREIDSSLLTKERLAEIVSEDPEFQSLRAGFEIHESLFIDFLYIQESDDMIFENCFQEKLDNQMMDLNIQQQMRPEFHEIQDIPEVPNVDIIIKVVKDRNYYDELNREFQSSTLRVSMIRALRHFSEKYKNNTLEKYFVNNGEHLALFTTILAAQKESGSSSKVPLLADEFAYQMLPDSVTVTALTNDQEFMNFKCNLHVRLEYSDNDEYKQQFLDSKEERKWRRDQEIKRKRFWKFLTYFRDGKSSCPAIYPEDLQHAKRAIDKKFIGMSRFSQDLIDQMKLFGSDIFSAPKGLIFYGPPGTGKSGISWKLCKHCGMAFVTQPLAAGDINKGIVGDSEATLNAIADRARLVPWDTVVVLIEEIESLVPDRKDPKNQGNSTGVLGVMLAIMDGSKMVPNLKVVASTNLLLTIDEAIRRRLDVQIFLGNPSRSQRAQWIDAKIGTVDKVLGKRRSRYEQQEQFYRVINNDQNLRNLIVNSTLNFSADAYRKLIEGYYDILLSKRLTSQQCKTELLMKIKKLSGDANINFGSMHVVDILQQGQSLEDYLDFRSLGDLERIAELNQFDDRGKRIQYAKRMLINLNADHNQQIPEYFQVERSEQILWTREDEHIYQRLKHQLQSGAELPVLDYFKVLVCIFLQFNHVPFLKEDNLYDIIRLKILTNESLSIIKQDFNQSAKPFLMKENDYQCPAYEELIEIVNLAFQEEIERQHLEVDQLVLIQDMAHKYMQALQFAKRPKTEIKYYPVFNDHSKYKDGWKYAILKFAEKYDSDMVVLIDSFYLEQNKASDDKEVATLIYQIISDMKKYTKCLLILDLDSICFIKEEYSNLKEGLKAATLNALQGFNNEATFSYNIQRQQALSQVLDLIANADPNGNIWYIAVSGHNKIILDYTIKLNWPKAPSVVAYEREESKKDENYKCSVCKVVFTKRENEGQEQKCKVHDNYLTFYFEEGNVKREVSNVTAEAMIRDQGKLAMMFKHKCCGKTVGQDGCVPRKHYARSERYYDTSLNDEHELVLSQTLLR